MPVHADIEELLKGATATVSADRPDAEQIGTAFRITPDYAVTAAHVAVPAGPRLRLAFGEGSACGASVVAASAQQARGSPWGFDDLAVLRLDRPGEVTAPCVLITEPVLKYDDALLVCALNGSRPERFLEVHHGYRFRDAQPPLFFTVDGGRPVVPGMSGAPVWSVRHGGVVGLFKASENVQTTQGGAISCLLECLRRRGTELYEEIVTAHDVYHRDEPAWVDRLPGGKDDEALVRRWVVETHGWLARIPTATERLVSQGLVDELFRDSPPFDTSRLLTLRDVVEYIGTECQSQGWDLSRFCALALKHLALTPDVAKAMQELPKRFLTAQRYRKFEQDFPAGRPEFDRPFAATRPESVEMTTVFGIIVPDEGPRLDDRSPIPHRYELAVKTGRDEIIAPESDGRCGSFEQAKQELKQALDSKLEAIAKPPETVEIVVALPDDHLIDDPLYEWRRSQERPFSKFMMRLRRSSTWEKTHEQVIELENRWTRLQESASDGLVWFGCGDARAQDLRTLQELFVENGPPDGVAVSTPPTPAVLTASSSNALPVTVWHTTGCAVHPDGGDICDGTAFRADIEARIDEQSPVDWYAAIWREQREHAGSEDRDEFWRKIVCIIDRPGESRRPTPLAGPGLRGS
ncbi:trypsin-like peptidase domain-containing protein [Nocardia sp. NPDC019395]|uniref:VMAP-C domain-containing protein n=1 Tax=Nocardia sp. NPDC019395 TaxID=3154686 RepID=UPI0033E46AAA